MTSRVTSEGPLSDLSLPEKGSTLEMSNSIYIISDSERSYVYVIFTALPRVATLIQDC